MTLHVFPDFDHLCSNGFLNAEWWLKRTQHLGWLAQPIEQLDKGANRLYCTSNAYTINIKWMSSLELGPSYWISGTTKWDAHNGARVSQFPSGMDFQDWPRINRLQSNHFRMGPRDPTWVPTQFPSIAHKPTECWCSMVKVPKIFTPSQE